MQRFFDVDRATTAAGRRPNRSISINRMPKASDGSAGSPQGLRERHAGTGENHGNRARRRTARAPPPLGTRTTTTGAAHAAILDRDAISMELPLKMVALLVNRQQQLQLKKVHLGGVHQTGSPTSTSWAAIGLNERSRVETGEQVVTNQITISELFLASDFSTC